MLGVQLQHKTDATGGLPKVSSRHCMQYVRDVQVINPKVRNAKHHKLTFECGPELPATLYWSAKPTLVCPIVSNAGHSVKVDKQFACKQYIL